MRFKAVTNAIIMTKRMQNAFKMKSRESSQSKGGMMTNLSDLKLARTTICTGEGSEIVDSETFMKDDEMNKNETESRSHTVPATPQERDSFISNHSQNSNNNNNNNNNSTHSKNSTENLEIEKDEPVKRKKKTPLSQSVNQAMLEEVAEAEADEDMSHMIACID